MTQKQKEAFDLTRQEIEWACYCNLEVAFLTAVDHIECIIKLGEGDIERKIKNAFEPYELAKFHVTHYACLGVDVMKGGYDPTMYGKKLQDVYEKLSPVAKTELFTRGIILCSLI